MYKHFISRDGNKLLELNLRSQRIMTIKISLESFLIKSNKTKSALSGIICEKEHKIKHIQTRVYIFIVTLSML